MNLPDPALVFLIGPAGSGKSTWAQSRYLPEEIVSSDRLRAVVGSGEADLDASDDAFAVLRQVVRARVGRRLTTVVDTLGFDDDLRAECMVAARAAGLPSVAVVLETLPAVCRERNRSRARPVPTKILDGQFRRATALRTRLDPEGWDVVAIVDASGEAVSELAPDPVPERVPETSDTGLDFVLHVSRFGWDEPLGEALGSIAGAAERVGFRGISVMDHLTQIPQVGRAWEDIPEPFTALAFLAGVTDRIELGPLVLNVTLRNPALVAKAVASLDALSGGRAFCGIGAGWYESEERAYGYAPVKTAERLDRLEDAARLLPRMWDKGSVTFEGKTISVDGAMTYPRPVRPVRLIVGGGGEQRTLRIAAVHADAVNVIGGPDLVRRKRAVLDRHCEEVGRDPTAVDVTVLDPALVGEDRREVAELVEAHRGRSAAAAYRERVGAGTVEELTARYEEFQEAGAATVFVALPNLRTAEEVERFAPLIPKLRK